MTFTYVVHHISTSRPYESTNLVSIFVQRVIDFEVIFLKHKNKIYVFIFYKEVSFDFVE